MGPDTSAPATESLPPIWNVPHRRNPNFTGRQNLLDSLRAALTSGQTAALTAISGMGGVGKTQLALEYAYRYVSQYQAVLWVPSEEPAALASAFAGLAQVLGLPEADEPEQGIAIKAVLRWLDTHQGWLLVFDNAPGPQELDEYLPQGASGHVLITSRYPNWRGVANPLSVQEFQRDESIDFLLKRTGATDRASANELADVLGDLPLALEQAGAYVEQTGGSLADYLSLFQTRHQELLQLETAPAGYEHTIATTWTISLQQLPETAADLLNLCAFLAPDDIPKELVSQGAEHIPEPLAGAAADTLALERAVAALRGYSLLEVSGDSWSVHRLVQAAVRGWLNDGDRKAWAEIAMVTVGASFPHDSDEVENWPACSRLLPHALAAADHAEGLGVAAEATGSTLNHVGVYLLGRAQFLQAKSALERSVAIGETALGLDSPELAARLNNLGIALRDMRDFERARDHLQRALDIDEASLGPEHPNVAIRLGNLGTVLRGMRDLDGAREHIQRSLAIHERVLGAENPMVATGLNNLGNVLRDMGDMEGALDHYQRSLPIVEAAYGPDHPEVAAALSNLGGFLHVLGALPEAQDHIQRALDIFRDRLGEEHPNTVIVRRQLESLRE